MTQHPRPNANWNLEQLTEYVRSCLKSRDDMNDQLTAVGRRSAVELFRAGHALHLLRLKLKVKNGYVQWLKNEKIARTTAHEATKLYLKAKTEQAVERFTITEAKIKFGFVKAKPKKTSDAKQRKDVKHDPEESQTLEIIRADQCLYIIKRKLQDVVQWDRSDLDPDELDRLANQCIQLLNAFVIKPPTLLLESQVIDVA